MSRCTAIVLLLLLLPAPAAAATSPGEAPEGAIKAAIVYNLARVVTWPDGAFGGAFVMEVRGADDQAPDFGTLAGKDVGGRPLVVAAGAGEATAHLLFVARSEAERCDDLLAACAGRPVLTVSEIEGFCERGGMVQLVRRSDRIRLRVNRAAAEAAGLRLSSQLLRVAELVAVGR